MTKVVPVNLAEWVEDPAHCRMGWVYFRAGEHRVCHLVPSGAQEVI